MKKAIFILAVLLALLAGCAAEETRPAPVTAAPEWAEVTSAAASSDPEILVYQDLTKSMMGFSGSDSSPISSTLMTLTNRARFDSGWQTYLLEPDAGGVLQWEACNPLLMAAAMINRNDAGSYTTAGDFDEGGPVNAVFRQAPDAGRVRVLITDLLEQEGQLNTLYEYTRTLFRADSHQQLYIAVADSPFSGKVTYPRIRGEEMVVRTVEYAGDRPFAVIAAGPAAGVAEVRRVIAEAKVPFAEYLIENRRATDVTVALTAAETLEQNILVGDMTRAHCIIDLAPAQVPGCFAFTYQKVSADHTRSARLALQALTNEEAALALEEGRWMRWQQAAPAETGGETIAASPWEWVPCDRPAGVSVSLQPAAAESAIPDLTAEHTGLADIAASDRGTLYELGMDLGEEAAGAAYSYQAALTIPVDNPLASSVPFAQWDISFSLYGQAEEDVSILRRIPDLCLFLNALSELDTNDNRVPVGDVRIIVQNYES